MKYELENLRLFRRNTKKSTVTKSFRSCIVVSILRFYLLKILSKDFFKKKKVSYYSIFFSSFFKFKLILNFLIVFKNARTQVSL